MNRNMHRKSQSSTTCVPKHSYMYVTFFLEMATPPPPFFFTEVIYIEVHNILLWIHKTTSKVHNEITYISIT